MSTMSGFYDAQSFIYVRSLAPNNTLSRIFFEKFLMVLYILASFL
jgi:hypothetical protein